MEKNSSACYLWDRKSKLEELTKTKLLMLLENYTKQSMKQFKNATYQEIVKKLKLDRMAPGIHVFPVGNSACVILLNKTKEQFLKLINKIKGLSEEESSDKVELTKVEDGKILDRFYDNWSITWEGMATESDNLKAIKKAINEANGHFNGHFYYIPGKFFNEYYGLTGNNAYPNDLHILVIDNPDCKGKDNLTLWIRTCGGRWYTDVVDNNKRRQQGN